MKKNKGIVFKLFRYLSGFVLFIVLLLLLLQTVFLEDFYKNIKRAEIRSAAQHALSIVDEEDELATYLSEKMITEDLCIHIVDEEGMLLYSSERFRDCDILRMTDAQRKTLYEETIAVASRETLTVTRGIGPPTEPEPRKVFGKGEHERLMYTIADEEAGVMVVIDSMITPMSATTSVLRVQILYVTGILILSAAVLAYVLSRKIAKPIMDINRSAKKLISGGYDLKLQDNAYREIDELNDTMTRTSIELGKTERLQKELIANISHDLRTPLTMIIGYAEVIRDLPGEDTKENVQVIIDEAQRLSNLVNDVLMISKASAELNKLQLERFDLTQLIDEIIDRCAKMTEAEGYQFEFSYEDTAEIEADRSKIGQVLYNLLGNAITHTGQDKSILVKQELVGEKGKEQVRVRIFDTGIGIAPEHLEDIWQRYYKVDKEHIRSSVGSGLGLSIVKDIVSAHGGSYGVESEVGRGSCFWITLPISER